MRQPQRSRTKRVAAYSDKEITIIFGPSVGNKVDVCGEGLDHGHDTELPSPPMLYLWVMPLF